MLCRVCVWDPDWSSRENSQLKIFLQSSCSDLIACLGTAHQTGLFCHFTSFLPVLFVPSFEDSRCEGEVELTEEGCFDISANVPRRVSILFTEWGNILPLSPFLADYLNASTFPSCSGGLF